MANNAYRALSPGDEYLRFGEDKSKSKRTVVTGMLTTAVLILIAAAALANLGVTIATFVNLPASTVVVEKVALKFAHARPETCYADNLPENSVLKGGTVPTYDYILAGAGTTGLTTLSAVIKNSQCNLKYLVVDAGRSYYELNILEDNVDDCSGVIDCYVRHLENIHHQAPSFAGFQSMSTRGTWPYITRPQTAASTQNYFDGRSITDTTCPFGHSGNIQNYSAPYAGFSLQLRPLFDDYNKYDAFNALYPAGCAMCPGTVYYYNGHLCDTQEKCKVAMNNAGKSAAEILQICGERVCMNDMTTCATHGTNLYYRTGAIGGSNSHHYMVTYPMSPYVANKFVELTGDARFAFANWEQYQKANDNDWQHLAYSGVKGTVAATWQNDTLVYNIFQNMLDMGKAKKGIFLVDNLSGFTGQKVIASQGGTIDLTDPLRIKNSDQFWLPENRAKYSNGVIMDHLLGRQINWLTLTRTYPIDYFNKMTATYCVGSKSANVVIKKYSLITKILFNDKGSDVSRQAIGVNYLPPVPGTNALHSFQLDMNYNAAETKTRLLTSTENAYATRGVILGGGTFNTPHFLMLSGIGNQKDLETIGFTNFRKHLPAVGSNLHDDNEHTLSYQINGWDPVAINGLDPRWANQTLTPWYVTDGYKSASFYNWDKMNTQSKVYIDLTYGESLNANGVRTGCNNLTVAAGIPGAKACPDRVIYGAPTGKVLMNDKAYDVWWKCRAGGQCYDETYKFPLFSGSEPSNMGEATAGRGIQMTMYSTLFEKLERKDPTCYYNMFAGSLFKAWYDITGNIRLFGVDILSSGIKASGKTIITSTDPSLPLVIDTQTFQDDEDLIKDANCVNNFRRFVKFFNTNKNLVGGWAGETNPAFNSISGGMQLVPFIQGWSNVPNEVPIYDGEFHSVYNIDSNSPGLVEYLRKSVWNHHPSSTARMGNIHDSNSVTDSYGRVWGTQNLFIVDNSNVPEPLDFFPSLPLVAFGVMQADAMCNVLSQSCVTTEPCSASAQEFIGVQGSDTFDPTL